MEKTGFLEKSPGNKSIMRLILLLSTTVCSAVALWGMYEVHRVVSSVLKGNAGAAALVGTLGLVVGAALGVIAGGEGFKALQTRSEVKGNNNV